MTSIVISFLTLMSIPVAVSLGIAGFRKFWLKQSYPAAGQLLREVMISVAITVGITLGICLVLSWTGFFDSQFYRPSGRNYGEHKKLGLTPEAVFFKSQDGTRLHGWFLTPKEPAEATIIHLHGSDRNISDAVKNSAWLKDRGFNVFVFDYRGYGKSEGKPSRSGLIDDSVAGIKYLRSRPDVDPNRILLWGQSMGGQLAVVGAHLTNEMKVRGIVAEATYASHSHHIKDKLAAMGPLWLVQWGAWLVTPDNHAAQEIVGRISPTPILFVHGTQDKVVRPYHSEWLFAAAKEPKYIWHVEGAGHLRIFQTKDHRERLVEFFRECVAKIEPVTGLHSERRIE